ncbi:MAG TPA: DUF2330 domain-containing protein [Polyangiaceae bacterium]|nr:DUF2330 domain-containing protein [Polyangiaceae bacterium]
MVRSRLAWAMGTAAAAASLAGLRDASACGGCFHPPTQTLTDITDEKMLLSVSATQSTLYDEIEYQGSPSSFAWVLPIHGTVTVGLSSDILFQSIDVLTATQIVPPPLNCPAPTNCFQASGLAAGAAENAAASGSSASSSVTVLSEATVGPYATVQLQSTDTSALVNWLTQNGYSIPASVTPILGAYVQEGFDFLAMKLVPNAGVQAMRPVRVTTPGAGLTLPLRMASVGTGAITGITIWVVADGRYEPQNFPFFYIPTSALVWDWAQNISNYTTLRVQDEANLNNAGWEIESSLALNEQLITSVILSGGQYYGSGIASSTPVDATQDYLPVGDPDAGDDDGGDAGGETADQVRNDDIATLFAGLTGPTVRVTRMRSDIAQAAMTADLVLQASSDQSELSNIRDVTQSVNETCPIYNGCTQVGSGTLAQAQASVSGSSTSGGSPGVGSGLPGTTSGAAANNGSSGGGGGGCIASPPGTRGSALGLVALAGMIGLFVGRIVRRRRPTSTHD